MLMHKAKRLLRDEERDVWEKDFIRMKNVITYLIFGS